MLFTVEDILSTYIIELTALIEYINSSTQKQELVCEFKVSLIDKGSPRTARRASQRNPVSEKIEKKRY